MLSRLNRELLLLDEKRDSETADSVFRLAHSIKGNLTMFGADEPASITHQMETILEGARKGTLELEDESFDVLFDGSSYLEEVVAAYLHGLEPPIPPKKLLGEINHFKELEKREAQKENSLDLESSLIALDATGEFYLSSRRREGAPLKQCLIEFEAGDQPCFLVAYLILRRIQRVADVIGSLPSMKDIEAGLCQNGIAVLISPRDPKPDLLESLDQNLKRYYGVTRFDAAPYA